MVYLASFNFNDFMDFTGGMGFTHNKGKYNGKVVADTDDTRYILVEHANDIKGLVNIKIAYTEKFNVKANNDRKKAMEREVEICNFNSNQYINFDILPNTIKEMMKE